MIENEVIVFLETREVICDGTSEQLAPMETDVLALLLSTPHQPVTYQCIAKTLWNIESDVITGSIESAIRRVVASIRKKISRG